MDGPEQQKALAKLEREMDGLRDPIDRLSARQDDLIRWTLGITPTCLSRCQDLMRWSLGITPTHKVGNPLPLSTAPEEFIPPEAACIPPWSNPPPSCGNSFDKTSLRVHHVVDQVYANMLPACKGA
jgi:hypothetical protein